MSVALSALCDGLAPHPAEGAFGFSALRAGTPVSGADPGKYTPGATRFAHPCYGFESCQSFFPGYRTGIALPKSGIRWNHNVSKLLIG